MKIVIPGGSGQLGSILTRHFLAQRNQVVVLTTRPTTIPGKDATVAQDRTKKIGENPNGPVLCHWDGRTLHSDWTDHIANADVVINLAGRSVDCRYNKVNRKQIMESRTESTRVIGQAITACKTPPRLWLQSSTATIYAHRYNAPNDEHNGILGGTEPNVPDTWNFSLDVAKSWEAAATSLPLPKTRLVLMRTAMVMSPDRGGVFDVLSRLARFGLGGRVGSGQQYMSWIHDADYVRAINWLIEHDDLTGPVNLSSPAPLPQAEFMRHLRQAWGSRIALPATHWMLEIATFLMRTESELILKSRRVIPTRLQQSGFKFEFEDWNKASQDLCNRWRSGN